MALLLSQLISLNDRQDQVRGVRAVVIDAVDCLHEVLFAFGRNRTAGIGVTIKAWEVAAGDFEPDAMSGLENVGRRSEINPQFVHMPRFHEHRLRE